LGEGLGLVLLLLYLWFNEGSFVHSYLQVPQLIVLHCRSIVIVMGAPDIVIHAFFSHDHYLLLLFFAFIADQGEHVLNHLVPLPLVLISKAFNHPSLHI